MESGVVNSNIILIKNYLQNELPKFSVLYENSYSMYWEIIFSDLEIEVKISGDAGGFSISVYIEKTEYPLWQYDRRVIRMAKTNDENILLQLIILKNFITDNK